MNVIGIKTQKVSIDCKKNLIDWITESIQKSGQKLLNNDIFVISSKVLSYFEGRVIPGDIIKVSASSRRIARKMKADPVLIQAVIDEADEVIAETPWVLLTRKHGIYCANAGVDTSNVPPNYLALWPQDPFRSARKIRSALVKRFHLKKVAVLIIDSACMPGRNGTLAMAIGFSGIKGYQDLKGKKDLYKKVLRYSGLNVVDSLATAANLIMGEGTEKTPLAIIRDLHWRSSSHMKKDEMIISSKNEMYPLR